jgi:hypothetical protein
MISLGLDIKTQRIAIPSIVLLKGKYMKRGVFRFHLIIFINIYKWQLAPIEFKSLQIIDIIYFQLGEWCLDLWM